MTRTRLLAIIMVCLFLETSLVPAMGQAPVQRYVYNMTFDHDGFTKVEVLYDSGFVGSGSSWIAVPKNFTQITVVALKGVIASMVRLPYLTGDRSLAHPFYDNLTFTYASESAPFSMDLCFNMTNGAMIVEPNGFFYSPQIGVPSSAQVQAKLTFPDGIESLDEVQPAPTQIDTGDSPGSLLFDLEPESRIAVTFTVSWTQRTSHIQDRQVSADVPSRYLDLATKIVELYDKAMPLMNDLFNGTVNQISMRFFAPSSLPELSIGGYTPIDPSSFQTGAIYLNLFYFRAVSGTMETIALHELTHQYETHGGISPNLLWVQEGLANYVAVQMGRYLDYDVSSTDADLESAASGLGGNYGMIQYWRPGGTAGSLFQYYAASYKIFKTLGNEYGGISLYSRFFAHVHELNDGLSSTNVAIYELGLSAHSDLSPQFAEWGFELVNLSNIAARISKLRAEAGFLGPLLPFREQALRHLELAQNSMYSAPETAVAHITIAAFYIETVPMITAGVVLVLILIVALVVVLRRRSKRRQVELDNQLGYYPFANG